MGDGKGDDFSFIIVGTNQLCGGLRLIENAMRAQAIYFCLIVGTALNQSPQQTPERMTRLAVRFQSPEVPANSFGAKPKLIYRGGDRYCRVEEAADIEHRIQALAIINEPDAWFVNLVTKTGRHKVDSASTQVCHLPLFAQDENRSPNREAHALRKALEFGREISYFQALGISPTNGPILFGKPTRAYTFEDRDFRLQLFTTGVSEHPLVVARTSGSRQEFYFYDAFEEIPFDPNLFVKPLRITIQEDVAPQTSPRQN